MSHAHGHMYLSALSPRRINQVYYHTTSDTTLVRFLPDMDMFSHPKSPLPNSNFSRYHLSNLLRDSSNIDRLLRRPRQCSSSFMHVVRRSEKSLLGVSQSVDNGRGDEATGETTEIRRAGMDSLEIDEDVPESVAGAINRRTINNLNGGDDGGHSETPETFKAKHMQQEVGRLRKKSSTVAPRSCGSQESPAGACQLARTER